MVYHGTTNDRETRTWNDKTKSYDTTNEPFTVFSRKPNGEKNAGFFFNSDADNAYGYGYNTYDVFLNMRNPYIIDAKGQSYSDINHNGKTHDSYDWANLAEKSGHDGLILNNVSDGVDFGALQTATTDYVAFSPNQIKSATDNTGEFSTENDDIRFRIAEDLSDVNERFNDELQQQIDGNLPAGHVYYLGMPSEILESTGIPYLPIELSAKRLAEKAAQRNHEFVLSDVRKLPEALQNPIAIFAYGNKAKAQNIIVELEKNGKKFVVGLHLNQNRRGLEVNDVRGLFPKDNAEWMNWISQGKSLYLDKEKIQDLIDKQRTNLAEVEYLNLDSVTNIINNFENPTVGNGDVLFRIADEEAEKTTNELREAADNATDLPLTEQEAALRDALAERLQEAGIEVEYVSEARLQELSELSGAKLEAKRKSEARRKRDEQNHAIDHVTSLITGLTEKEARQERLRWEQQHRDLAKEIYEAALQGNFNDVTLQKINKYIDESTPKNTFGRRISQRVPQKMERSLHAGHRTNAVDALFTRISESAVGDAGTKLARNRSEREGAKEIKKGLLKGWAIATGNWHTDIHDFTNDSEPFAQGRDSTVYKSKDGRYVIKFSKGKSDKRFSTDIDAGNLFSFVFPSTAYDIVGYGEIDGNFVTILRQPVVDIERPLTEQERVDYMRSLGFEPMNKENTTFTNGNIVVSDLQRGNIVFSKKGNIAVLDADVKLYTKDIGGAYIYPPAATDTEQRIDSEQPKFQRDENSVIYGAAYNGKIYLNAERLSLDTPIHEYTHIWDAACQMNNPELWKLGVEIITSPSQLPNEEKKTQHGKLANKST